MRINEDYLDNVEIADNTEDEVTADVNIEEQYEQRLFLMIGAVSVDKFAPQIQCLKFLYRTLSSSQVIEGDGFGIQVTYVKDVSYYGQNVGREDFLFNSTT
jgi:precorrin-6x reductase